MCGQGTTVGGDFSELRAIIDKVRDQSRVGVCLDTCHAFAAGEPHLPLGPVKSGQSRFLLGWMFSRQGAVCKALIVSH